MGYAHLRENHAGRQAGRQMLVSSDTHLQYNKYKPYGRWAKTAGISNQVLKFMKIMQHGQWLSNMRV